LRSDTAFGEDRRMRRSLPVLALALVTGLLAATAATAADHPPRVDEVQRGLEALVAADGGPPGAVATLYRHGKLTVLRAGRADVDRGRPPRARDHMRIASVAKAFSGATALSLVRDERLGLDDTIAQRLPGMPPAWAAVTIRQLLNHTSGLPDYTESDGFVEQVETDPTGFVAPATVIDWVRAEDVNFPPGTRYRYSNTDNIVIGLIAEAVTGQRYPDLLADVVFEPADLDDTSFPTRRLTLPRPFISGYVTEPGEEPVDVTSFLSPSGAWASGAIVSTPADLNAFIRAYLRPRFFGEAEQREQLRFVADGSSSPPGPGENSAGLGVFRYETRCGTVYGHTGNFPGYVQFAAATADGKRAVTTSLNIPAPRGALLAQLREVQADAVCALMKG
jgi:D-alanyl-D-alanine carboxypeptidase